MRRRLLNLLTALSMLLCAVSCQALVPPPGKLPPLLRDGVLWRLDEEARDYRRATGALPQWGTDLPADAVERLGPLPDGLRLDFVRFHPSDHEGVVVEWRPLGEKDEWLWARVDGRDVFTSRGAYPGGRR